MNQYRTADGELYHHGVKGMKWGIRRYQNEDGSLTPAGRKRYDSDVADLAEKKKTYKTAGDAYAKSFSKAHGRSLAAYSPFKKHRKANDERWDDANTKAQELRNAKAAYKTAKKDFKRNGGKTVEKFLRKEEKREYKAFVKERSKEILAGETVVARLYDRYTGAHKHKAQLEWNLRKYNN